MGSKLVGGKLVASGSASGIVEAKPLSANLLALTGSSAARAMVNVMMTQVMVLDAVIKVVVDNMDQ